MSSLHSIVQLFVTPWIIAHQAPLSMGTLQARILEWVVMPSSGGSSQLRDQTCVSCIGRWVLYYQCHLGSRLLVPTEELKDSLFCLSPEEELEL